MTVSIVIPVYNAADYLEECIRSALGQTYKDTEVIAIDDGSTDNSLEILRSFENKITVVEKENGGTASALNAGIRNMTGEWFKWLSADDVLYPNAVEILVRVGESLGERGKNSILYGSCDMIDSDSKVFATYREPNLNDMDQLEHTICLMHSFIGNGSMSMLHRSMFERFGRFSEDLERAEDIEMWLRLCALHCCRLHAVPEVLGAYRHHGRQLSVTMTGTEQRIRDDIVTSILERMDDALLRETYEWGLRQLKYVTPRQRMSNAIKRVAIRAITVSLPAHMSEQILYRYRCRRYGIEYAKQAREIEKHTGG